MRKLKTLAESIGSSIVTELIGGSDVLQNLDAFVGRLVKVKPAGQSASVQNVDALINSIASIEKMKAGDGYGIRIKGRVSDFDFTVDKSNLDKFLDGKQVTSGNYSLTLS